MASLTRDDSGQSSSGDPKGTQEIERGGSSAASLSTLVNSVPTLYKWGAGLALIAVVLVASLAFWGPGMEYPTTVSTSQIPTNSGTSITLEKTLRQQTGAGIDEAVKWLTVSGDWLFDGIATAITYALIYIEDTLKWIPWPALIVAMTLLAFAMGRWSLAAFTAVAMLFIGFMDLWKTR